MPGEHARRRLADMADTKGKDVPGQIRGLAVPDGREQIVDGLLVGRSPLGVATEKVNISRCLPFFQREDIRRFRDQTISKERLDLLGAQTFDVKRGSTDEMLKLFDRLRRAYHAAGAAPHRVAFFPDRLRSTFRTCRRKDISCGL